MQIDDDLRAEATRLLSLDEAGQRAEILARALQSQRDSDASSKELQDLDRRFLEELTDAIDVDLEGTG